jgi:hypothetical protein
VQEEVRNVARLLAAAVRDWRSGALPPPAEVKPPRDK